MTFPRVPPTARHLARLSGALAVAVLSACGGGPQRVDETPTVAVSTVTQPRGWEEVTLSPAPESQWSSEFSAAAAALEQQNWMDAETALRPLETSLLNSYDGQQLAFLRARIAHVRGQESAALSQLSALEQVALPAGLDYEVYAFHQELLHLTGRYLEAAQQGVTALRLSGGSNSRELKQAVWRDLQRTRTAELDSALAVSADPDWRGWLELSLLTRRPDGDLAERLRQWQAGYPGHGAANPLPGGLENLAAARTGVDNVALILPLSGRLSAAGKAVRDGYLAAWFAAREQGAAPGQLQVIDSEGFAGASEAYQHAVAGGAQLVIGPLQKEAVAELDALLERPAPIIALNRIDSLAQATPQFPRGATAAALDPNEVDALAPALPLSPPQPLIQLALAPEDEVRCLADRAFGEGIRRILVLRPAGEWGDKVESTLLARWQSLGGSVAGLVSYTGAEEYSESVKAGMGIAASEARRSRVRDMLASNVEFTPRRRQDIDAVMLLSPGPADARALKPLLAFYYAGALPVYAPSGIYSGHREARDRDLNGVRVVEIPWLVDGSELRDALDQAGLDAYPRLNALGADAYLLQSRFSQLADAPSALLRGNTGLLSLNGEGQVERDLPLAEFDGGRLQPR